MKTLVTATLLSFVIGTATAFAQAPAGPASPPAKMSADEKKAVSKACSEQANAKNLHGKDRQKFRAACIKTGGKSA
jgi:psiF repeat